ncbi:MAG TPA: GNAT family N-acetyltransferase [Terracidiphilus sp.]|jgi:GNAT superfamily N-acetyltransferase
MRLDLVNHRPSDDILELVTETNRADERPIVVREMMQEDAEAVAHLTVQLGYSRTPEEIAAWLAHLDRNAAEQAAFVACLDSEIVGWIEVSIERRLQSAAYAMIGGLVIAEMVRGRGIGQLLCQHVEQWTWDHGIDTLRVTSRSTRAGAHRFYLRDAYREVKTSLVFEKDNPRKANRP